jgi:hypothetical protein
MDRDEMSNLDRGPSIDASCQVSVHLAEGFQRRRLKCEKLTDDRCQMMAKAEEETHKSLHLFPGDHSFSIFSLTFSCDNKEILGG